MFIYKINILVNDNEDNAQIQYQIDEFVQKALDDFLNEVPNNYLQFLSTQIVDLQQTSNLGRCSQCGEWTSDSRYEGYVEEVSNGSRVDGKWFCDICLPESHPNHF